MMFIKGLGRDTHYFTASSQDTNSRLIASQLLYGTPTSVPIPDLTRTDLLVMMGANPVVSHGSFLTAPRIKDRMHDIVKRGGRVVVVDPRRTETAAQFEWLGIVPDADAFLLLSLLQVMFAEGLVDRRRVQRQADGIDWLQALAEPFTPEATASTPASSRSVRSLARDLAAYAAGRHLRAVRNLCRTLRHTHHLPDRRGQPRRRQPRPPGRLGVQLDGHARPEVAEHARWASGCGGSYRTPLPHRRHSERDRLGARGPDGQGDRHAGRPPDQGVVRQRRAIRCCRCPTATSSRPRSTGWTCRWRSTSTSPKPPPIATTCCPSPRCTSVTTFPFTFQTFQATPFRQATEAVVAPAGEARTEWDIIDDLTQSAGGADRCSPRSVRPKSAGCLRC